MHTCKEPAGLYSPCYIFISLLHCPSSARHMAITEHVCGAYIHRAALSDLRVVVTLCPEDTMAKQEIILVQVSHTTRLIKL